MNRPKTKKLSFSQYAFFKSTPRFNFDLLRLITLATIDIFHNHFQGVTEGMSTQKLKEPGFWVRLQKFFGGIDI